MGCAMTVSSLGSDVLGRAFRVCLGKFRQSRQTFSRAALGERLPLPIASHNAVRHETTLFCSYLKCGGAGEALFPSCSRS